MTTENLQTLKIHKLSQEQYERELAAGRIDNNALYLTPDTASNSGSGKYDQHVWRKETCITYDQQVAPTTELDTWTIPTPLVLYNYGSTWTLKICPIVTFDKRNNIVFDDDVRSFKFTCPEQGFDGYDYTCTYEIYDSYNDEYMSLLEFQNYWRDNIANTSIYMQFVYSVPQNVPQTSLIRYVDHVQLQISSSSGSDSAGDTVYYDYIDNIITKCLQVTKQEPDLTSEIVYSANSDAYSTERQEIENGWIQYIYLGTPSIALPTNAQYNQHAWHRKGYKQPIYDLQQTTTTLDLESTFMNWNQTPVSFFLGHRTHDVRTGEISLNNSREIRCYALRESQSMTLIRDTCYGDYHVLWGYEDRTSLSKGLIHNDDSIFNTDELYYPQVSPLKPFEVDDSNLCDYLYQLIDEESYDTLLYGGTFYNIQRSDPQYNSNSKYDSSTADDYYYVYPIFQNVELLKSVHINDNDTYIGIDDIIYSPSPTTYIEGKDGDGLEYTYLGIPSQSFGSVVSRSNNGVATGIISGNYTGTGSSMTLTFNAPPKLLIISNRGSANSRNICFSIPVTGMGIILDDYHDSQMGVAEGNATSINVTLSGNSVSLGAAISQSNVRYDYIAMI